MLAIYLDLSALASPVTPQPLPNADLITQADAFLKEERSYMEGLFDLTDEWEERHQALLEKIDALPATPENIEAKAMGLRMIYENNGDFDQWESVTTDNRLARDIFKGMMTQRGWERPDWFGANYFLGVVQEATWCELVWSGSHVVAAPVPHHLAKGIQNPERAMQMLAALPPHRRDQVAANLRRRAERGAQ